MNVLLKFNDAAIATRTGKYKEAEELYADIITNIETHLNNELFNKSKLLAEAYNNLGYVLYRQVNFEEATVNYNTAIQYDNTLAAAFYNRGTVSYRLGDYQLALKDMKQAVLLEPQNSEFMSALKDTEKAISHSF